MDVALSASETLDDCLRERNLELFASWVWRKANDHVTWEYGIYNAEMSGLWQPMVSVDSKCILSPSFSVLGNVVEEVISNLLED